MKKKTNLTAEQNTVGWLET